MDCRYNNNIPTGATSKGVGLLGVSNYKNQPHRNRIGYSRARIKILYYYKYNKKNNVYQIRRRVCELSPSEWCEGVRALRLNSIAENSDPYKKVSGVFRPRNNNCVPRTPSRVVAVRWGSPEVFVRLRCGFRLPSPRHLTSPKWRTNAHAQFQHNLGAQT